MRGTGRPIFLLSLPRSGSTFVQRVLASHPDVATTSEPWLLLPYMYTLREVGAVAEYGHVLQVRAVRDFADELPGGTGDYLEGIRELALGLYSRAAREGERYFLDKTPRYHLIVDDLLRLFPDGKFVFLWRNPLAVVASIMERWGGGKWNLYRYEIDLFRGLESLVRASREYEERVWAGRYEDLATLSETAWGPVFEYLDLPFVPEALREDTVALKGRMGDRGDRPEARDPAIEKWRGALSNPLRKAWARRYLRWIGADRLQAMGYDLGRLSAELSSLPSGGRLIASDAARIGFGRVRRLQRSWIFGDRPPRASSAGGGRPADLLLRGTSQQG